MKMYYIINVGLIINNQRRLKMKSDYYEKREKRIESYEKLAEQELKRLKKKKVIGTEELLLLEKNHNLIHYPSLSGILGKKIQEILLPTVR